MDKSLLIARAKDLIKNNPTWGKNHINAELRTEYGEGLRSESILKLKAEVAHDNPKLAPELYRVGGVSTKLLPIYNQWRASGFLPYEARELTVGHGNEFDAQAVFDSLPAQRTREFRMKIIKEQKGMDWSMKRIRDNILDFYIRSKDASPWEHIRAEYQPKKKDFISYDRLSERRQKKAKNKQNRLLRGYKK